MTEKKISDLHDIRLDSVLPLKPVFTDNRYRDGTVRIINNIYNDYLTKNDQLTVDNLIKQVKETCISAAWPNIPTDIEILGILATGTPDHHSDVSKEPVELTNSWQDIIDELVDSTLKDYKTCNNTVYILPLIADIKRRWSCMGWATIDDKDIIRSLNRYVSDNNGYKFDISPSDAAIYLEIESTLNSINSTKPELGVLVNKILKDHKTVNGAVNIGGLIEDVQKQAKLFGWGDIPPADIILALSICSGTAYSPQTDVTAKQIGIYSEPITSKAPPVGLVPRWIRAEQRLSEIASAVDRYMTHRKTIPQEWIDEYQEIAHYLQQRKTK